MHCEDIECSLIVSGAELPDSPDFKLDLMISWYMKVMDFMCVQDEYKVGIFVSNGLEQIDKYIDDVFL